jgi:regulator of protease activity HflC (stomatin/prohibitin superfamily)
MSLILSWIFGWLLGLGLPILIAAGAGSLAVTTTGAIRSLAVNVLIVAGCWAGMTGITQSVVGEAIQHEREAVQEAVAAEQARQAEAGAKALASLQEQLAEALMDEAEANARADDLEKFYLANPVAGRGATQRDIDALK